MSIWLARIDGSSVLDDLVLHILTLESSSSSYSRKSDESSYPAAGSKTVLMRPNQTMLGAGGINATASANSASPSPKEQVHCVGGEGNQG